MYILIATLSSGASEGAADWRELTRVCQRLLGFAGGSCAAKRAAAAVRHRQAELNGAGLFVPGWFVGI
jgi:hypothetical protein